MPVRCCSGAREDHGQPCKEDRSSHEFAGDRIRFEFGGHVTEGKILEDRGNVGAGGERLLRVQVEVAQTDATMEFEIRAADVKSAA
jgi:hypothetical protein